MIAGLGNLVWFVYGGGLDQASAFAAIPEWAAMIGVAYGVIGLFAITRAIDHSMNALRAASVHHPLVWNNFEVNEEFNHGKVRELAALSDEAFYMSVIRSSVRTLQSREQELNRIMDKTARAQRLLRYGLMSAALGVLYSSSLAGMVYLFSAIL